MSRSATAGRSRAGARSKPRPAARRKPGPSARRSPASRRSRAAARTRRPATGVRRVWPYRIAILLLLAAALGAGYLLWLRDSSLVAVDDVEVKGVTRGDYERIVAELTAAGESMTTLHLEPERVDAAAAKFSTIQSVELDANFPHGLVITVSERTPALVAESGGEEIAIAGDGTLLPGIQASEDLPRLELGSLPPGGRLTGEPRAQAAVAGAVPAPMIGLIDELEVTKDHGVVATLRGDIPVRFGSASGAGEKWEAAAAVLADPKLESLCYVDVRVAERPAAGCAG